MTDMKGTSLLILSASLAACGPGRVEKPASAETAPAAVNHVTSPALRDCPVSAGDSAYAVCWATRPDRADGPPRRVYEVIRRADTVCVITGPGDPATLDGMRRTKVVFTAVVENLESDSIGCR